MKYSAHHDPIHDQVQTTIFNYDITGRKLTALTHSSVFVKKGRGGNGNTFYVFAFRLLM